jgi:type VI secretion system secreted protein VgrG
MVFTQEHRLLSFTTPLGPDVLLLQELQGHEGISTLFRFDLELLAEDDAIPFDKLVGQNVTIRLALAEAHDRYINGFVSRFAQGRSDVRFTHYHAEVVPWLWFLTRSADCRIFQDLSVPDIIKKIFHQHGFSDFREALTRTYTPWDYCVQYRETDFNFVSRLMEQEGIFYFFEHEHGQHTLVLADAPEAHRPCPPDQLEARYLPEAGMGGWEDTVTSWRMEQELRSGRYSLRDYHDQMPDKSFEVTEPTSINVGRNDQFEIYDYPGAYAPRFNKPDPERLDAVESEGRTLVKLRMQEEESSHLVISGTSFCRAFSAGQRFKLTDHSRPDANGDYVLTAVQHTAVQTPPYVSGPDIAEPYYHNSFTCIPHRVPFRPPRRTPKPIMHTQTAIVVGEAGEEITVDKYGRVKVQFHWDRQGEANEHSSCWIRVAQNWAGKRWGAMFIPRIGQEVIVDFLEGDPNQPIITGRVYNAEEMPPYELSGEKPEKTKSTIKSLSSKGGGGFNELRFEDMKGKEQIFIHGERDLDVRIKNDRREWIGNDRHLFVKRDRREQVGGDEHVLIKVDLVEEIGRDHYLKIGGKEAIEITGSHSLAVTGNVTEAFQANHSEQVTGNYYVKAMNVVIEGMSGLTIKVGGSFITLTPAGIQIVGPMVMINSGGAALVGVPGALVSPLSPTAAEVADNADPGSKEMTYTTQRAAMSPEQRAASEAPRHDPNAEENKQKKSWIEIELVDEAGQPVPGERYRITLPDGTTIADGSLDEKGCARVSGIDPGTCKVTFPNLDKEAWQVK